MLAMSLGFVDYVFIAVIVSMFGAGATVVFNAQDKARLARLEAKVDLLLNHAGLELDPDAEVPEDVRKAIQEEEDRSQ